MPVSLHSRRISLHFGGKSIWKRSGLCRDVFVTPGSRMATLGSLPTFLVNYSLFVACSTESTVHSTVRCGESRNSCFKTFYFRNCHLFELSDHSIARVFTESQRHSFLSCFFWSKGRQWSSHSCWLLQSAKAS